MRRDRLAQRCANAIACSGLAALALAIAHQRDLSIAVSAIGLALVLFFLALSVRSVRR